MRVLKIASLVVSSLLFLSGVASAQSATTGAIAGVVRDTTGAVLPGVTVEAASPALIEKVRSVVADERGQYKIVDLRPGTYTVTFTLAGFSTFKREGLALTTGFTATTDAELRVGSLEETVTVSGASPVVDVQNVRTQNVLPREVLDALPAAKSFLTFARLTVGATAARDVGGNKGEGFGASFNIHGARGDGKLTIDGMTINSPVNSGNNTRFHTNPLTFQEVVLETAGKGAESETGGVNIVIVSKEGGNTFSGTFNTDYTGKALQGKNLSDALKARGLTRSNAVKKIYDIGFAGGGPIKKDRLWFYTAHRWWGSEEELAGVYYNKLHGTLFYEPDLSRPAYTKNWDRSNTLRVTWQAAPKHKFTFSEQSTRNCGCFFWLGPTRSPEASVDFWFAPNHMMQGTWTYPATNRLLFEAGSALSIDVQENQRIAETASTDRSVVELSTGITYGSMVSGSNPNLLGAADTGPGWLSDYGYHGNAGYRSTRFAMSYVTGSHAFKTGVSAYAGKVLVGGVTNFPVQYTFRNRIPVSLTQIATPNRSEDHIKLNLGIFAQDQWTLRNLTLNVGVRFDYFNGYIPEQIRPAGEFVPELKFAPLYNVPNFKDINPRLGAAYDLFGNSRTAVKVSVGRYLGTQGVGIPFATNPAEATAGTVSRTWSDTNGNFVPDCDLKNPVATGECGPLSNNRFGTSVPTRRYADDARLGFGNREYNWQTSVSVQQELRPGVGLTVGYFRTAYGNVTVVDNAAVTPADYATFCVTAPKDARLAGGGGNQVCGLFDVSPAKFGVTDRVTTLASNFGKRTEAFNGFDVSVNSRFGKGGLLSGGVSTGRTALDNCDSPDFPNQFCRNVNPWAGQMQVKFSGAYTMFWGLQASAVFQNLPGLNISSTYVATNAEIAPSLGRNLGSCGAAPVCNGTAVISLIQPNTRREPRQTQVDFRLGKSVRIGAARLQPRLDIFNLLNAGDIQAMNTRYGAAWLNATDLLAARLFKFGVQVDF